MNVRTKSGEDSYRLMKMPRLKKTGTFKTGQEMKVDIRDFYDIAGKLTDFGVPVNIFEDDDNLVLFLDKDDPSCGQLIFDKHGENGIKFKEITFLKNSTYVRDFH
jgi:hypothetical protein